ncbi:MAG TPA: SIMPL domain-containing protein [Allosphingosinicella sp.]|nr:SIMPL domain-containing protein [Allosphingosinicella sp.]
MRLAGLAAALALAGTAAGAAAQQVPIALAPGEVLLNVEAGGEHRSRPDVMTITAGVVTTASSAREALAANSALANRLIDVVRSKGIEPRDVKTAELSVDPRLEELSDEDEDRGRTPRVLGYVATNKLELRLRDLNKAPDIVDALFAGGANSVQGPEFSLADPAPAERLARRAAVAAARLEADTYAEALGMRISRVLRVSERGRFDSDGGDIIVTGSRIPHTPVEPGELTTRITVWIDYAMVPR